MRMTLLQKIYVYKVDGTNRNDHSRSAGQYSNVTYQGVFFHSLEG